MRTRQWGILAWATLIVIALGVGLSIWRDHDSALKPKPAFPQLESQLNDITRVQIRGAGNAVATLERTDHGWVVVEKSRYPADSGMLRKELLQLARLELVEAKTKKPENYAQLGVQGVDQAGSEAIEVKISGANNAEIAQILVGKTAPGGGYVRLGQDAQTWLASVRPSFSVKPQEWMDKEISTVDANRVRMVVVESGKTAFTVQKAEGSDTPVLKDVPKTRAVRESELRRLMGALNSLRFDDVVPMAEAPAAKDAVKSRFVTGDGLLMEVTAYKQGEKFYASFTPSYSAPVQPSTAPVAASTANAGEPAKATPLPNNTNVQAEVEKLRQRVNGWAYVIPNSQGEILTANREAMLEPLVKLKGKK